MNDIEAMLAEYLTERMDVPVAADVPEDKPEAFVSFERTGGGFSDFVVDNATVAVQCWAMTRAQARRLAYEVDALIRGMPDAIDDVAVAERNSLYNFPDPDSKRPRYQAVFDFKIQY